MSRINTAALQQPTNGNQQSQRSQQNQDFMAPDLDIQADGVVGTYGFGMEEEEPEKEDPQAPYLKQIAENVQGMNQNTQYQQQFARIAMDPNVQAVLQAQQQGKKVKIVEDQDADPFALPQQQEGEPNWEELGQHPDKMAQHLTKTITGQVTRTMFPAIKQMMIKQMEPINMLAQQVGQMGQFIKSIQNDKLKGEMDTVRGRNPQLFDQLRPQMSELAANNQGLDYEALFLLAQHKAGIPPTMGTSMQSERPTQQTASRQPQQYENPRQKALLNQPGGRQLNPKAAFDQTLANLMSKTNLPEFEIQA